MSESFLQVPPDSTGKRLRSRLRTFASDSSQVQEQLYVRGTQLKRAGGPWVAHTPRITGLNSGPYVLASLAIPHQGTHHVAVREVWLAADFTAAVTAPVIARVWSHGGQATVGGGNAISPRPLWGMGGDGLAAPTVEAQPTVANWASFLSRASTDGGANADINMNSNPSVIAEAFLPRPHTLVGLLATPKINLLPDSAREDYPYVIRPTNGANIMFIGLENGIAATAHFMVSVVFEYFVP